MTGTQIVWVLRDKHSPHVEWRTTDKAVAARWKDETRRARAGRYTLTRETQHA